VSIDRELMTEPVRTCSAMVLAAGRGTRMRSSRPKPAHLLCGRPMVGYVLGALRGLPLDRAVVVVGHGAELVTQVLTAHRPPGIDVDVVEQRSQKGTGHAVIVGLSAFDELELDDEDADLIVVPGDTPLLEADTLAALHRVHVAENAGATLLTARVADPTGYGRIVRSGDGRVERIVEHVDAGPEELQIDEVNTSVYCFRRSLLPAALRKVDGINAQGEVYLTDVIEVLRSTGYPVIPVVADDPAETMGVNDRQQLAVCEAALRERTNRRWMAEGVTMLDPSSSYIDTTVELAPDVTIFPNTLLQGACVVGEGAEVGPDVRLINTTVGPRTRLQSTSATGAQVGPDCMVGPFAVLGPGSELAAGTVTGPFFSSS